MKIVNPNVRPVLAYAALGAIAINLVTAFLLFITTGTEFGGGLAFALAIGTFFYVYVAMGDDDRRARSAAGFMAFADICYAGASVSARQAPTAIVLDLLAAACLAWVYTQLGEKMRTEPVATEAKSPET